MERSLSSLILRHWQRKILALFTSIILWLFVNHSITTTQIVPNVPIRVINLPPEKTIAGLHPNGLLKRRITLTVSGTKDVVKELEPGDLEILVDASTADSDDWIIKVTKKNLISLNPSINLSHHITEINHGEFIIHLSHLYTARVAVDLLPPSGNAPAGYLYLDLWPQRLYQTISGPEEEVRKIESKGLALQLDLSDISKETLDLLPPFTIAGIQNNEISYGLPSRYKKIKIPFRDELEEELNDPEAATLELNFLRLEWLAIDLPLPIRPFYPVKYLNTLNAQTLQIKVSPPIIEKGGVQLYDKPLLLYGVSELFLKAVRNNIEISVIAAPPEQKPLLHWSLGAVDAPELENTYIAMLFTSDKLLAGNKSLIRHREALLRKRFNNYLQKMVLYTREEQKLYMDWVIENNQIVLR